MVDTISGAVIPLAELIGQTPANSATLANVYFLGDGGRVVCTVTAPGDGVATTALHLVSPAGVTTATVDRALTFLPTGQFIYLP